VRETGHAIGTGMGNILIVQQGQRNTRRTWPSFYPLSCPKPTGTGFTKWTSSARRAPSATILSVCHTPRVRTGGSTSADASGPNECGCSGVTGWTSCSTIGSMLLPHAVLLSDPQYITLAQRIPIDTWTGIGVGAH